jgi:hypothetical protein
MKFTYGLLLCLILLSGFMFSACDPNQSDIDVACSKHALISAINTANASPTVTTTLHLSPACLYELSEAMIYDSDLYPAGVGLPAITSQIVVDGQAATIQRSKAIGTDEFRFFLIQSGGNLSLDQVTLRNGNVEVSHGYGGAILNYGTLAINNSQILENKAYRGGAVYSSGQISSSLSEYLNNQAAFMGGAIQNTGTMQVTQDLFKENIGYYGGAIANHTGSGSAANSNFVSNRAQAGDTFGFGGAISNTSISSAMGDRGTMVIDLSTLTGNFAREGGAIANFNFSDCMIRESSLLENSAQYGGAILNQDEMEIIRSTLANNTAEYFGGAVFYQDSDDPVGMAIGNSTISGNQLKSGNMDGGSAVYHLNGMVLARHVTITNNLGAAAWVEVAGQTQMINNIVANNANGDCAGSAINGIQVYTYANLDSDGSCPGFTHTAYPMLEGLADNGGPTMTHALQAYSPALDAAETIVEYTIDQRTEIRPHGPESDLGAFESQVYVAGPTQQITSMTPPPQVVTIEPVPEVKQKEPNYYWWLFEGFVCSDMDLTEFYIRTTSLKDYFTLTANGKPVICYQQRYNKERYWCYVEKRSLGWNTAVTVQFCEGENCTSITRTTLEETKCQDSVLPAEPVKVTCPGFLTQDDCAAAPGCIWVCSGGVTAAEVCDCREAADE